MGRSLRFGLYQLHESAFFRLELVWTRLQKEASPFRTNILLFGACQRL